MYYLRNYLGTSRQLNRLNRGSMIQVGNFATSCCQNTREIVPPVAGLFNSLLLWFFISLLTLCHSIFRVISDPEKLANDLQIAFPGVEGFSKRNVFLVRAFCRENKIVPPLVAQIDEIEHALRRIPNLATACGQIRRTDDILYPKRNLRCC